MTDDKPNWPTEAEVRASFPTLPGFGATILMMPVADHEAEIARLTAERDAAILAKDCFQRMTRAHWEALCAMRNSINEFIPMPNTDSGPLFSPEDGPIYANIAELVIADLTESRAYALALEQELRDRAEKAEAERDAAMAVARKAHDALWELNPNNYDHDEVCKLNDGAIEAILTLAPLIGETHGYSPEWWNQRAAIQPGPDARQADLAKAWQPIETAPKDGTRFLGVACGTEWASYNIVIWDWHKNRKTGNFKGYSGVWTPTHWMPLPPPPVQP